MVFDGAARRRTNDARGRQDEKPFNGRDMTVGTRRPAFRTGGRPAKDRGGMGCSGTRGRLRRLRAEGRLPDDEAGLQLGVFVRIADRPADEWFAVHNGYECRYWTRPMSTTDGCIYSLAPAKASDPWRRRVNSMEITLDATSCASL